MLPALPRCSRWAYLSLKNYPSVSAFPDSTFGSACTSTFRGLLGVYSRCGLHTRAVTNFVTAIRGLQTFRHLHACPGCFRLERSPGGACTRWISAALSRRTWKAVILRIRSAPKRCSLQAEFHHSLSRRSPCGTGGRDE